MTDIYTCIETCVQFALHNGLCMPEDEHYVRNGLLALFAGRARGGRMPRNPAMHRRNI